ncbi:MAG TPA: DUF4384 domain-containing protein [Gemmatimonadales bacterium]
MLLSLLVAFSATPPVTALRADDPPVRVWLDPDAYVNTGDRMRVHLRAAEDGYVIVLRADAQGRVRVLFPLDPTDDAFLRGGKTFEVKSRGDREAFSVDDASGTGTVLAAWSASPFKSDAYAVNGHWDYRVLAERRVADDPEAGLLDIVNAMAGDNHFDYDVATYTVGTDTRVAYGSRYDGWYSDPLYDPYFASCWGCGPWGWGGYGGYRWRFGFGVGYGCDPWFCDPFYNPWGYYPGGGYIFTYAYQPHPGWFMQPRSWGPGRFGPRAFTLRPNSPPFVLPSTRVRERTASAQPRPRMWNPPPPVITRPRSGGDGARPAARPEPRREPRPDVKPSSPPPRREARPPSPPPRREAHPSSGHESSGSRGGGGGRRKP